VPIWVVVLVGGMGLLVGGVVAGVVVAVGDEGGGGDPEPATSDIHTVAIGSCFTYPWTDSLDLAFGAPGDADVVVVDCASPHDGEVHARASLPGDTWPGDTQAMKLAYRLCQDAVAGYVGVPYLESEAEVEAWWPERDDWDAGDTTVTCSVHAGYDQETGSLRDAKR
jgi:hypothetical protein